VNADAFFTFADRLHTELVGAEILFSHLSSESSDFVRLNRNRVRQAGHVRSAALGLTLVEGARQVEGGCDLTGDPLQDQAHARRLLGRLRERLAHVPDDPYLSFSTEPAESERRSGEHLPDAAEAVGELIGAADGLDLVGIWASGDMADGLASSLGHRHWHESASFNLDWSCYLEADKAVKAAYSGFRWDQKRCAGGSRRCGRVCASWPAPREPWSPDATGPIWPRAPSRADGHALLGRFRPQEPQDPSDPAARLVRGERGFHPQIGIREEHDRGLAACFTPEGFPVPPRVDLVEGGRFAGCLVDARSGKEYDEVVNAAGGYPGSLGLDPGTSSRPRSCAASTPASGSAISGIATGLIRTTVA
jgi:hypothetical protein